MYFEHPRKKNGISYRTFMNKALFPSSWCQENGAKYHQEKSSCCSI